MKSRVHPTYKTKYHVQNWASYDRALVRRGDITIWLSPAAIAAWEPDGAGTRGAQRKYSDLAIESALTLRLLFHLPLRQAEGFLTSLFVLMGLDLRSPDHTTLSRRGQHLDRTLRGVPRRAGLDLIIDNTGLSIVGEGEWAAAKHGGRGTRGWKKLHVGVDQTGVIVAHALTEATVDDATTGVELIEAVNDDITRVTADTAYDTVAFYDVAGARGATVVVPPAKTARVSRRRPRSSARDRTINKREENRMATVEEDVTVPSASASRERSLQVQVDHRRWSSSQDTRWANGRSAARVQHAECDDRHGPPSFLRHRSMKHRWLGPWRASFDSCTNAPMTCPDGPWTLAFLPARRSHLRAPLGRRSLLHRHDHLMHRHHGGLPRINPELFKDGHQSLPELVECRLRCPDVEYHELVARAKRRMIRPPRRVAGPGFSQQLDALVVFC